MRVGQKNGLVCPWAKRGTCPRQPKDQRYANAYVFGAVCPVRDTPARDTPARDTGAALVMPRADTEAMQKHLEDISLTVAAGAQALLTLDNAGWHTTGKLRVPANITFVFLPPACPECNPGENIWQYLHQTSLSNRLFDSDEVLCEACRQVWRKLTAEAGRIQTIASRTWDTIGQNP